MLLRCFIVLLTHAPFCADIEYTTFCADIEYTTCCADELTNFRNMFPFASCQLSLLSLALEVWYRIAISLGIENYYFPRPFVAWRGESVDK